MTDKPEAGRTCAVWCGGDCGDQYHDRCWGDVMECWCSPECEAAARPLNPAPRPVEHDKWCELKWKQVGCFCSDRRKPRPVERCSCEESQTYAEALRRIFATCAMDTGQDAVDDLVDISTIARRALALGEE